jgi:hypothetical protein
MVADITTSIDMETRIRLAEMRLALSLQAVAIAKAECSEFAAYIDGVEVIEAFESGRPLSISR